MELINYKNIKGSKVRTFYDDFKEKMDNITFGISYILYEKPDAIKINWSYFGVEVDQKQPFIGRFFKKIYKTKV